MRFSLPETLGETDRCYPRLELSRLGADTPQDAGAPITSNHSTVGKVITIFSIRPDTLEPVAHGAVSTHRELVNGGGVEQ
ncbi:hypothetical protein [Bradyrhizobium sp. Bra64]|uniref:hypothetical protein n=1 Tax=Bradyrhizobium sp. Bra64 TaxID=2926009 RepID=UPI002117674A|nr:hypothetical protein [Bradyrhizobium sp. Bra64]